MKTASNLTFNAQTNEVLGIGFIHSVHIDDEEILVKQQLPTTTITGSITHYCLEGKDVIKFYPKPSETKVATIVHTPSISPLLLGNEINEDASNWLLAEAPDIYFYAILTTIALATNDVRLPVWKAAYDSAVRGYTSVHAIEVTRGNL